MVNVIQQAIEALRGVIRVADRATVEFDAAKAALASLRAAQEGDLPPLPEPGLPGDEGACCGNYVTGAEYMGERETLCCGCPDGAYPDGFTADQMREYARTAIAAAGGGVPPGWKLVPVEPTAEMWAAVNKLDDEMAAGGYDGKGCTIEQAWECLLASSPQPEAAMTQQERDILQGMREIKDGKGTEAAQSPAEKEGDAIAELNHQQWLALSQCAALVSACHRLSAESEEYDFDDGLGRGAQQAYWDEFDSALERAGEALDQANKETQRIHATQFVQPSQPEAAPAVAQVPLTDDQLADCVPDGAQIIEHEGERNRVSMTRQQLHQFAANVLAVAQSKGQA